MRIYVEKNPEKVLRRIKKWRKENPEKYLEQSRRYRRNNKEKCRIYDRENMRKIRKTDEYKNYAENYSKNMIFKLTDVYVKAQIRKRNKIKFDIPDWLIKLKRQHIINLRLGKQLKEIKQ